MKYQYGSFENNGTQFTVTRPDTPRAFDNFLWNDSVMSNIQQTGVGCFDYQIGDKEAVQLFTGNGRVCDFDIFGRDTLMSRLIYIRDRDTGEYWNLNWEPVCAPYEDFRCTHGMGYTQIENQTQHIESGFRVFVPQGADPVELWRIRLKNRGAGRRRLSVFVYCQFQFRYKWGFDSYGDMLFRSVTFSKEDNAVVARKHPHVRPHSFLTAFLTADKQAVAYDGTRDAFVGVYSSLKCPKALTEGRCSNTPGSSDATVGAMQFDMELNGGGEEEIALILGVVSEKAEIARYREKYLGCMEEAFERLKESKEEMSRSFRASTPDEHFDRMLNYWIKEQSAFGAAWCRWGWNGFRDIVQHGMGVASIMPWRTKEIIVEALRHQYNSGLAVRGWNPLDTKPYSDSALWLVFTLTAYLQETNDTGILDEVIPYLDEGEDGVLGHICKTLDFLETHKGSHGLCLIQFGDWNDSLTAVGREGKGESVWLSEAYAEALSEMERLYRRLGEAENAMNCQARRERILEAINREAWDGEWYVRCFDDRGEAVGSHSNEEGQIFGEAQAWALITGAADPQRAAVLMEACDRLLKTPQGYRLLAPTFTKENGRIGRISCMEPGICENGTIYSHVNAWFILGLLRQGEVLKAYEALKRITSGYVTGPEDRKQKCPPYVYANCYYGPDHKNNAYQMEFTWITGSIAWFQKILLQDMLGVQPDFDGLVIAPRIPQDWNEYTVEKKYQGAVYQIHVTNPQGLCMGEAALTMDGVPLKGNRIKSLRDGRTHRVEAVLHNLPEQEAVPILMKSEN